MRGGGEGERGRRGNGGTGRGRGGGGMGEWGGGEREWGNGEGERGNGGMGRGREGMGEWGGGEREWGNGEGERGNGGMGRGGGGMGRGGGGMGEWGGGEGEVGRWNGGMRGGGGRGEGGMGEGGVGGAAHTRPQALAGPVVSLEIQLLPVVSPMGSVTDSAHIFPQRNFTYYSLYILLYSRRYTSAFLSKPLRLVLTLHFVSCSLLTLYQSCLGLRTVTVLTGHTVVFDGCRCRTVNDSTWLFHSRQRYGMSPIFGHQKTAVNGKLRFLRVSVLVFTSPVAETEKNCN
jgi:hypothetical protein